MCCYTCTTLNIADTLGTVLKIFIQVFDISKVSCMGPRDSVLLIEDGFSIIDLSEAQIHLCM